MHIILIGNYPHDRQESMQRFADMLRRGLSERGHTVELIRPQPVIGRLKPGGSGLGKWLGYIDKFVIFPRRLRRIVKSYKLSVISYQEETAGNLKPGTKNQEQKTKHQEQSTKNKKPGTKNKAPSTHDSVVYHICDHSNAMYSKWLQDVPHVVTCHDLLAVRSALGEIPQNPTGWSGKILQRWIRSWVGRVPLLACVSRATRADALRLSERKEDTTPVVLNGLNYHYRQLARDDGLAIARKLSGQRDLVGYLFHVGGTQWYKNRSGLIRMYAEFVRLLPTAPPLVIAGKQPPPAIRQLIREQKLSDRIFHLGRVDGDDLNALYSGAECLVFPSLAEGFGWPVIEAQACGCPVVTSNRPPMNEIAGTAGVMIDPEDIEASSGRIKEFLQLPAEQRAELVRAGLKNAQRFSSETMISGYEEIYSELSNS